MKKLPLLFFFFVFALSGFSSFAQNANPDTVTVGIYITSVHDIDFKQKEYSMNLWLWLKYRRPEFDFMKNLEVPMAKSFEKSYATLDTLEDGRLYILMKLECKMKGIWNIKDFPFDRQKLRFSIENSMYDSKELIFKEDTLGEHYGKYFLVSWEKESFDIKSDIKVYETSFGDPDLTEPHAEYSNYKVTVVIHRQSWELFLKLFLGMYISFLIAFCCFFIHPEKMDARLTLSVGSLFAVIGNKYIVDSTLPESSSFTLVDTLHGLTLFYIFISIAYSIYVFRTNKTEQMPNLDKIVGWISFAIYVMLSAYFVYSSYSAEIVT